LGDGTHDVPATHAAHAPVRQTEPFGHVLVVPSSWNVVSVQTGAPVSQVVAAAVAQGFVEVQDAPGVHAVHTPALLQVPDVVPEVQAVPTGWNVWSVQTGAPLVQTVVALVAQGFVEVHAAPCVHELHVALVPLHTPCTPLTLHAIPAAWNV
jgi:hypothetical protein